MKMILLGSGTSYGVPTIGCGCAVCTSKDKHDKRFRSSAYIESNGTNLVIDTGPDFRTQILAQHILHLDAVLLTHGHADHLNGLDDVRSFHRRGLKDDSHDSVLPLYANAETLDEVKTRFAYIFTSDCVGGGKPNIALHDVNEFSEEHPLVIGDMHIIPIAMVHGNLHPTGYLMTIEKNGKKKSIAYLTDCNTIPESSLEIIQRDAGCLEHAVIDGLRETVHDTHFTYRQAIDVGIKLRANHIWLTHLCHNANHKQITAYCKNCMRELKFPGTIKPAYDGLSIAVHLT